MKKKTSIVTILMLTMLCAAFLSGCADALTFQQAAEAVPVGFWYGIWHGMITPITFWISLFNPDVAIYAINNNGGWYDFGFLWGIGTSTGFQIRINNDLGGKR